MANELRVYIELFCFTFAAALGFRCFLNAAGTWLMVASITRYSSLAAICMSGVVLVVSLMVLGPVPSFPLIIMSFILFSRHHANIVRLLAGQEPKIGQK